FAEHVEPGGESHGHTEVLRRVTHARCARRLPRSRDHRAAQYAADAREGKTTRAIGLVRQKRAFEGVPDARAFPGPLRRKLAVVSMQQGGSAVLKRLPSDALRQAAAIAQTITTRALLPLLGSVAQLPPARAHSAETPCHRTEHSAKVHACSLPLGE